MKAIIVALPMLLLGLAGCIAGPFDDPLPPADPAQGCSTTRSGLPDLCDVGPWVNSDGVDLDALYGEVVMIDFWTYSCINCIRTFPHLTALYDTYAPYGFTIIGVHSPEFEFEKNTNNIEYAVEKHGIHYPVVNDADMIIWRHHETRYWPTHHVIDATGVIRETHFGEGGYAKTEDLVRKLLTENGATDLPPKVEPLPSGGALQTDVTPELYVGTWRQAWTIGNHDKYQPGKTVDYEADDAGERDRVYLDGAWTNGYEAFTAASDGKVFLQFRAGAVNTVIAPSEPGCYPIWLDGQPVPEALRGGDVVERDGSTCIEVGVEDSYDLYQGKVETHTLRFDVPAGTELYTFAFSRQDMSMM